MGFTKKYIVGSHKDIVDNFISMAIPDIVREEDTIIGSVKGYRAWEQLDDRYADKTTFFGHTFEVPMSNYEKKIGHVKLVLDDSIESSTAYFNVGSYFPYDEGYESSDKCSKRVVSLSNYPNTLSNDIIETFGKENVSIVRKQLITLDDVIASLSDMYSVHTPKKYLIFCGVEGSLLAGLSQSDIIGKLEYIGQFCKSYGIRPILVATFKGIDSSIVSDERHILDRGYSGLEILNLYDYLFDDYDTASSSKVHDTIYKYIHEGLFMNIIYNNIKYFIVYKFLCMFRDRFYISLVHMNIDSGSYPTLGYAHGLHSDGIVPSIHDYSYPNSYFSKYCGDFAFGEYVPRGSSNAIDTYFESKYSNKGKEWNLFKNYGEIVAICLHTDFNRKLYVCEQAQATCLNEWQKSHEDSFGVVDKLQNLLKIRHWCAFKEFSPLVPFSYPMSGAPWFTISEDNKKEYSNGVGIFSQEVFLTRHNDFSGTITFRLHSKSDVAHDCYQSISFGMLDFPRTDNYKYCLFCAGGTQGISADIYSYYPVSGTRKYLMGNVYDLDVHNICMSNSNLLHPTSFNGSVVSNFKLMLPSGLWASVFVHNQIAHVVSYPSLGPPPDHALCLDDVAFTSGNTSGAYPYLANNKHRIGSKYLHMQGFNNTVGKDDYTYRYSSQLDPITVVINPKESYDEGYCFGNVPDAFACWDFETPTGEILIDGKRYLSIPNGWDGRLYHYGDDHFKIMNDIWDTDMIVDHYEEIYSLLYEDVKIKDRLLIKME